MTPCGRHATRMGRARVGGEGGIRTPGPFPISGFQDRRFKPLTHLSAFRGGAHGPPSCPPSFPVHGTGELGVGQFPAPGAPEHPWGPTAPPPSRQGTKVREVGTWSRNTGGRWPRPRSRACRSPPLPWLPPGQVASPRSLRKPLEGSPGPGSGHPPSPGRESAPCSTRS